jgi:lipopolysaccharide assembly protein B
MTLDWTWLLVALPIAFGLGWLFSRLDVLHWRLEARHEPKAYFKGLNHLLSGQQDHAVDSFIEAVQNDPDTSELHFTLGNLFRRRGEYDRAVRVHEHLLARADLSQEDRVRAQLALAQDYSRAGILDRAQAVLTGLETKEALTLLLSVHERGRDWGNAAKVAMQLQNLGAGNFDKKRAHYLCEQQKFDEAMAIAPDSPRAYLEAAKISESIKAFDLLGLAWKNAPQAAPLLALPWFNLATTQEQKDVVTQALQVNYEQTQSLDVLQALIQMDEASATTAYRDHLIKIPSLVAARHLIDEQLVQASLSKAIAPLLRYRCAACGFEAKQYFWQCPGCQAWDSYPFKRVEEL